MTHGLQSKKSSRQILGVILFISVTGLNTKSKLNLRKTNSDFYLKCVPRSRPGRKGRSMTTVVPVPVAHRRTVCVWLSCIKISNLPSNWIVSFRCATTLSSSWLLTGLNTLKGLSGGLKKHRSYNLSQLTVWTWWAEVLPQESFPRKGQCSPSNSSFHQWNVMLENISPVGAFSITVWHKAIEILEI